MRPLILQGHSRPLTLVKFNADGDLLLTCGKDSQINLWYSHNGERVGSYIGHTGAVFAVDITHDSKYVVSGGADSQIIFWEALTGQIIYKCDFGGLIKFVEFNQRAGDQNMVAVCNDQFAKTPHRICVLRWDVERDPDSVEEEFSIQGTSLPQKATKVKWGPLDASLLSCHEEGTVMVWDSMTGDRLRVIEAHFKAVTSMQFSSDRMLMITSSKDRSAKLWDMSVTLDRSFEEDAYRKFIFEYKSDRPLNDAAISPLFDKKDHARHHIFCGGGQEAMDVTTQAGKEGQFMTQVFHMVLQEEIGKVHGHFGPMNTIAVMQDGSGFVTGGEDGYVRLHHFDPEYHTSSRL